MKYIHLAEVCFKDAQVTYDCRSATTHEEISELIAKGYDYVTEHDGIKYFRKAELV